jgi:hypothetical protein
LLSWLACPWGWPTTARDARPHKEGSRTREAFLGTLHLMAAWATELQLTPHKSLAWCLRPDHIDAVLRRCRQARRPASARGASASASADAAAAASSAVADAAPAPAAAAAAASTPAAAAKAPELSAGRMYQFAQTAFKAHSWLRSVEPQLAGQPEVREAEVVMRTAMHQVCASMRSVCVCERTCTGVRVVVCGLSRGVAAVQH